MRMSVADEEAEDQYLVRHIKRYKLSDWFEKDLNTRHTTTYMTVLVIRKTHGDEERVALADFEGSLR